MWFYNNAVKANMSQLNNNGWIPVSERLPEDCGDVICTAHLKGYEVNNTIPLWYNANKKAWFGSDDKKVNTNLVVVAWQPLPAPYIPKQEEQKGIKK